MVEAWNQLVVDADEHVGTSGPGADVVGPGDLEQGIDDGAPLEATVQLRLASATPLCARLVELFDRQMRPSMRDVMGASEPEASPRQQGN